LYLSNIFQRKSMNPVDARESKCCEGLFAPPQVNFLQQCQSILAEQQGAASPDESLLTDGHLDAADRSMRAVSSSVDAELVSASSIVNTKKLKRTQKKQVKQGRPKLGRQGAILQLLLVEKVLRWLVDGLVLQLLRWNFYCTDGDSTGQQTLYYRQNTWHQISRIALSELCVGQFRHMPEASARESFLAPRRNLGVSRIRFRPRKTGVRPIVNMAKSAALLLRDTEPVLRARNSGALKYPIKESKAVKGVTIQRVYSVNYALRDSFEVLRKISLDSPSLLGATVMGYSHIYEQLAPFLLCCARESIGGVLPPVYMVSVDVKHCFDRINREALMELLLREIEREEKRSNEDGGLDTACLNSLAIMI
jgi:hypothetical protein